MVVLMVIAGLAEGVGVVTLIPMLELAESGAEPTSDLGRTVVRALGAMGLEPKLSTLLIVVVVLITLKALFLLLANRQVGYTLARVTRDLRLSLLRALLSVRWRYFSTRTIGQFANAITTEAQRASAAYKEACFLMAALFQVSAYLIVLWLLSWKVAVTTVIVGILMSWLLRRFVREGRSAGRTQTVLNRALSSRVVDVLQGIKPLKAMGREGLVWPLLEEETDGLMVAHRRQVLASEGLKAFQEPMLTILLAMGLYLVLDVGGQPLSSALVLAFVFYRLMRHINTMQERYQVMTIGESAFFALVGELGEARHEEEHPGGCVMPGPLRDRITLRGISFSYDDSPVLGGVDLTIPAGSFITIAGGSGSGKTTLADLIAGLYEPEKGEIKVDGVSLRELDLRAWRKRIGYVPQEMLLLNDTVLRNVTLGDESLSREDVERALVQAGAWEFVREKPGGVEHRVGERGGMLSGGQRQRIAIARALVTHPTLLILDEVTTALDPLTEQAICKTLRSLTPEVTILSISHQAALRDASDESYLMMDGHLERQSTEVATR